MKRYTIERNNNRERINFIINVIIHQGTPCDLVTGEERRYGNLNGSPSSHVACTVEMTSLSTPCKHTFKFKDT